MSDITLKDENVRAVEQSECICKGGILPLPCIHQLAAELLKAREKIAEADRGLSLLLRRFRDGTSREGLEVTVLAILGGLRGWSEGPPT